MERVEGDVGALQHRFKKNKEGDIQVAGLEDRR